MALEPAHCQPNESESLELEQTRAGRFAGVSFVTLWAATIGAAALIDAPWPVRRAALFLHLSALVAAFGAVLVTDVHGALWLAGRRRLEDLVRVTRILEPVIWSGLVGLMVSGVLLHPDLGVARTWVKFAFVLAAGVNGLWAHRLSKRLDADFPAEPGDLSDQRLLVRVLASGAISQAAWWGATLIGFLATTS